MTKEMTREEILDYFYNQNGIIQHGNLYYRYNLIEDVVEFVNTNLTTGYWKRTAISKDTLQNLPENTLQKVKLDPNWLATKKKDVIQFTVREELTIAPEDVIYTLLPYPNNDSKYIVSFFKYGEGQSIPYDKELVEIHFAIGAWIPL